MAAGIAAYFARFELLARQDLVLEQILRALAVSLGKRQTGFRFAMLRGLGLKLDLEMLTESWADQSVGNAADWMELKKLEQSLRDNRDFSAPRPAVSLEEFSLFMNPACQLDNLFI